jgi:hypothetical protein
MAKPSIMNIKRFNLDTEFGEMEPSETGEYVLSTDYDKLQSSLSAISGDHRVRFEDAKQSSIDSIRSILQAQQPHELHALSRELVDCFRAADSEGLMSLIAQNERALEIWNRRISTAFSELEEYVNRD